jgi:hypothetical protein
VQFLVTKLITVSQFRYYFFAGLKGERVKNIVFAVVLFLSSYAFATDSKPFALDVALDVPTNYYFRGYRNQTSGVTVQPSARFSYTVFNNNDLTVKPYVGSWNDLNSDTSGTKNWKAWNESDINAGVSLEYKVFTLDIGYNLYAYPSGAVKNSHGTMGSSTQEFGFTLSLDDSDVSKSLHLPFPLQPHLGFYHETSDHSNNSSDGYLELGITPSFVLSEKWTLNVPVVFGNSTDHYYVSSNGHSEFFGYGSIGVDLKYQINDQWFIHGGVTYANLFAKALREANGGGSNVVTGIVGVGLSL